MEYIFSSAKLFELREKSAIGQQNLRSKRQRTAALQDVAVIFAPLSSLALWSAAVLRRFSMQQIKRDPEGFPPGYRMRARPWR